MTEVIEQVLPGPPRAPIRPNIAREIMAGKAAATVVATEDLAVGSAIQKVVTTWRLPCVSEPGRRPLGNRGGALKNVIAIVAGIGQRLGGRQHPGGGDVARTGRALTVSASPWGRGRLFRWWDGT